MNFNARITAYSARTGAKGDGTPALSAVALAFAMPVWLAEPSFSVRRRAEAEGVEVAATLIVPRERLVGFGLTPAAGDRLTLERAAISGANGFAAAETFEVIKLDPRGDVGAHAMPLVQPVVLWLKEARDGA